VWISSHDLDAPVPSPVKVKMKVKSNVCSSWPTAYARVVPATVAGRMRRR
jgi:hypothetical protein